jgi:hypothetical protein
VHLFKFFCGGGLKRGGCGHCRREGEEGMHLGNIPSHLVMCFPFALRLIPHFITCKMFRVAEALLEVQPVVIFRDMVDNRVIGHALEHCAATDRRPAVQPSVLASYVSRVISREIKIKIKRKKTG